MDLIFVLLSLIAIPFAYLLIYFLTTPRHLPPGPRGLPYIGYNPKPSTVHETFLEKSYQYGPVWSYFRFGTLMVTVNDLESFNDLFLVNGEKFLNRPTRFMQRHSGNYGVLFNNGIQWKTHRRFSLSTLRNFGFGKSIVEESIRSETDHLMEGIRNKMDRPMDLQNILSNAVSNIICQLIMGRRYEYSDAAFWDVINLVNKMVVGVHPVTICGLPDWVLRLALLTKGGKRLAKTREQSLNIQEFMKDYIAVHKTEYDPQDEPTDYIQAFVKEQIKGTPTFHDTQLFVAMYNMFAAGMETTSNTLRWGILYLILNPDIQEKVHQEITEVCGTDSYPTLKNKSDLPYTEATLLETQRIANTVAITMREASDDLCYKGMFIPKGAVVFPNIWGIHMNPKTFKNPEIFSPERFLDPKSGRIDKAKAELIVPFGAGKRVCLGEGLAKMELFLFFTALIQQFKFRIPVGKIPPSTSPVVGIVNSVKPFDVAIESRY